MFQGAIGDLILITGVQANNRRTKYLWRIEKILYHQFSNKKKKLSILRRNRTGHFKMHLMSEYLCNVHFILVIFLLLEAKRLLQFTFSVCPFRMMVSSTSRFITL